MKTLYSVIIYSLAYSLCLLLLGCDDFVDTDRPNSQLTTGAVFEDATTANAAMINIYAHMREDGLVSGKSFGMASLLGVYADELDSYETSAYSTADFYNNAVLSSNPLISSLWNSSYNEVYSANLLMEGVQNSSLSESVRNSLTGEALFVRAFTHFNLMNVFGEVPYITTTDLDTNKFVPRMPTGLIYEKVIADLQQAMLLLPQDYMTPERIRPNKGAAQALLARVYLYNNQYAEAADMASAVLNNEGVYPWPNDPGNVFMKESPGTIWQLATGSPGANTYEAGTFVFQAGPPSLVALTDSFVSSFEPGDLRRTYWIKEVTEGTDTWYHPYKYKQDVAGGSSTEYSIMFRLSEQYLIRAEARARQGELIGAREDLDKVRLAAGLAGTDAVTQAGILEAIVSERWHELFTEGGHRFLDLRRYGMLDAVLSTKPGWGATDRLWPLPQSELLVNPALAPQNPSY